MEATPKEAEKLADKSHDDFGEWMIGTRRKPMSKARDKPSKVSLSQFDKSSQSLYDRTSPRVVELERVAGKRKAPQSLHAVTPREEGRSNKSHQDKPANGKSSKRNGTHANHQKAKSAVGSQRKDRSGLSSPEEQSLGDHAKSMLEISHRQASGACPPTVSSSSSETISEMRSSEKFLTEAEKEWVDLVITKRKILQNKPVECSVKGNLHRVKMIQFVKAETSGTILIRATQEMMGILNHSVTLFREKLVRKPEMIAAWRLRDTKDSSFAG
nr:hypothetical protein CFP56_70873 [Quercus suber]